MTAESFRLLDLLQELRNRICHCVLEDIAPQTVDLLNVISYLPQSALTAVSCQIRERVLLLPHSGLNVHAPLSAASSTADDSDQMDVQIMAEMRSCDLMMERSKTSHSLGVCKL